MNDQEYDLLKFAEWCGDNYVRLANVWVHRFDNAFDSSKWLTTEQLLEMYKSTQVSVNNIEKESKENELEPNNKERHGEQ